MSYTIIYKVVARPQGNGKFKFDYLVGCNNVYEWNNKKRARARDWYQEEMITKGEALTPGELDQKLAEFLQKCVDSYKSYASQEEFNAPLFKRHFGWYEGIAIYGSHTTKTSWGRLRNLYINALKKAMANETV
jgi:hypothetical protein